MKLLTATVSSLYILVCVAASADTLAPNERLITLLGTNDIHGALLPATMPDGTVVGGMTYWAGVVRSHRLGIQKEYGAQAGLLVIDAGDQFQGTLLSNYNEGTAIFSAMSRIGYDVAITGNHDYDFGPVGWKVDQGPGDPRGALIRAEGLASFPIVSANTFLRATLVDMSGKSVNAAAVGCAPQAPSDLNTQIDWDKAEQPSFLKPYLIKEVSGVRVALIGIDLFNTPPVTTAANVADLCFADEYTTYKRVRASLQGKADVFVLVMHKGDTNNTFDGSDLVTKITADGPAQVDAVFAGHTHFKNNLVIQGVPMIQSGSSLTLFGRIDLVYDTSAHTVIRDRVKRWAGIQLSQDHCDTANAPDICSADPGTKTVSYEGVPVVPDSSVQTVIDQARADMLKEVNPDEILGAATQDLAADRISESALADALTDGFRASSGADVAFMNTGGIRAPLKAGNITFGELYQVLPFNNHGIVLAPVSSDKILSLLNQSIQTCGSYGALMQSGLRVSFSRDCSTTRTGVDPNAKLLHVEMLNGTVIYDANSGGNIAQDRIFSVATLDFLATGGSGYAGFPAPAAQIKDVGILHDVIADLYRKTPARLEGKMDGRWAQVTGR